MAIRTVKGEKVSRQKARAILRGKLVGDYSLGYIFAYPVSSKRRDINRAIDEMRRVDQHNRKVENSIEPLEQMLMRLDLPF